MLLLSCFPQFTTETTFNLSHFQLCRLNDLLLWVAPCSPHNGFNQTNIYRSQKDKRQVRGIKWEEENERGITLGTEFLYSHRWLLSRCLQKERSREGWEAAQPQASTFSAIEFHVFPVSHSCLSQVPRMHFRSILSRHFRVSEGMLAAMIYNRLTNDGRVVRGARG